MAPTIILGAGMSGLTAARSLTNAGREVKVIDKGRGVGGRMATRRIGDAVIDHGAQFFTTRGEAFVDLVAQASADDAVAEWCRGFGEPDGFPRYRGASGMTSLPKWMAAGLDVSLGVEVAAIEASGDGVAFVDAAGSPIAVGADAVLTAPIPQTLRLLDAGGVIIEPDLDARLRAVDYFATFALLVLVDGATDIGAPGGIQLDEGPFTFISDNQQKGISPVTALTFHAEHDYSLRRFDDPRDEVRDELLELARPWIGPATVTDAQLMRWRYAGPVTPLPEPTVVIQSGPTRLALAGDAFAGPKVEGAFNSGLAAAQAL